MEEAINGTIENTSMNEQAPMMEQMPQGGVENNFDWHSLLNDELKNSFAGSRFRDVNELASAYNNALELVGKRVQDFSEQDWQLYSQIQNQFNDIPATAEEYKIDPTPMDDSYMNTFTDDDVVGIKNLAKGMGLNQTQAQVLTQSMNVIANNFINNYAAEKQAVVEDWISELKNDWGSAFESKTHSIDYCIDNILPQLTHKSPNEIRDTIRELGLGCNPILMKTFAALGEMYAEKGTRTYTNLAPQDANIAFEQLKMDPDYQAAIANKYHPRHREFMMKMDIYTNAKHNTL